MSAPARAMAPSSDATTEPTSTLRGAARFFFSRAGVRLLAGQLLLALLARPFFGAPRFAEAIVLGGVLVYWPLQEWFFHWTLLHMKPRQLGRWRFDPYFARSHRYHHRHPWDIDTAFLPLRVLFTLGPIHLLFWWLVTPSLGAALTGIASFTLATLIYEWTHYLTHTPYRPRGRYYRWIRRNHRMHHFRNENYWHSFTAPFLDTAFGTGPEPRTVPRSGTCHDLGVDDSA